MQVSKLTMVLAAVSALGAAAPRAASQAQSSAPAPHGSAGAALLPLVSGLDGQWRGGLKLEGRELALVLHVATEGGGSRASIDSPDQGAFAIPVSLLEHSGATVTFRIAAVGASFKGTMSANGGTISGVFTQGGHDLPLSLVRQPAGSSSTKLARPQEDAIAAAPAPYDVQTVAFDNPSAPGVRLAGVLSLPRRGRAAPAAVLIAGSGPLTRDEEVFRHKVFLVLADHLTRHGVAVLRYDKRGVGQSTGDYKAATTADFASDAQAALAFLRARPEVSADKVGLIGHSEGGVIAPMVAATDAKVAFVVLLAGPGVPGHLLLAEQDRLIRLASHEPAPEVGRAYQIERRVFAAIAAAKDSQAAQASVRQIMADATPKPAPPEVEQMVKYASSAWMRWFLAHDPAPTLRRIRAPVLAVTGEKDLQVPPSINLPSMRAALAANPDATVIEMRGLNHPFQHAATGSPSEYATISETLAPELLQTLSDWIGKHVG